MGRDLVEVLVVGNSSGAIHGSLVMTGYLVRALGDLGCRVTVLDRAFSRKNTEIGKLRLHKFSRAAGMLARAAGLRLGRRFDAAFYLPASLPPALTFDYCLFPLLRRASKLWIGYSHMVRYRSICTGRSRFHARRVRSFWGSFERCIGPSSAVAKDLEDIGVPPDRVRTVPNCLPPGWAYAAPDDACERAGKAPSAILFLSTVRARKGIWDLLEAYALVSESGEAVPPLEIMGPETDAGIFGDISAWSASKGLDGRVRILGELSHGEIEKRFASGGSVFVFPTRREEAFGLVLVEAMSKGVPVVATDIGAIPEVLEGGRAGLLVPPQNPVTLAEALSKLLGDAGLRRDLAARGLDASRKYSYESFRTAVRGVLNWSGIPSRMLSP